MLYENGNKVTEVQKRATEITEIEEGKVCAFLQGAVYCWCETKKDKSFMARDFVGGDNKDWGGTPLQVIYDHRCESGSPDPVGVAGQDLGHLLKLVLMKDKRTFNRVEDTRVAEYIWDGNPA